MSAVLAANLILLAICGNGSTPFASRVLEYAPAPGQFVNVSSFNDPLRALGPPFGGGTAQPNNTSVVTLGGFGGSIVLGFDARVEDHPLNPQGLDAIVFGNAHWVSGDKNRHWAECATIEISLDENDNGLADDRWYLIPGSHLPSVPAQIEVTWDDDIGDESFGPDDEFWIPSGASGTWSTFAYRLPGNFETVPLRNPATFPGLEGIWGYADYTPTVLLGDLDSDNVVDDSTIAADEFYTWPDDPFTVGITQGSGGGDAFDIAWAVDPHTGQLAALAGFDFIRITTAVHFVLEPFGELSAEIDAVADVRIDPFGDFDGDEDVDLKDLALLLACMSRGEDDCFEFGQPGGFAIKEDLAAVLGRMTGPLQ